MATTGDAILTVAQWWVIWVLIVLAVAAVIGCCSLVVLLSLAQQL